MRHRDGSWRWFLARGELRRDEHGKPLRMLGCHLDITERKRADEERQAHVWFLESMDRVNRAVQGASRSRSADGRRARSDVVDLRLRPGLPGASVRSRRGCLERARRASPARVPQRRWRASRHPMTDEHVHRFRTLREADGPLCFGPGSAHPLPEGARQVGVQSLIAMAVYPHADQPYAFGLHQCSYARVWTSDEERLLQEIGRRLADGLTSRFVLRSLRASEGRLAEAQRVAHVGHWNRDFGHWPGDPVLGVDAHLRHQVPPARSRRLGCAVALGRPPRRPAARRRRARRSAARRRALRRRIPRRARRRPGAVRPQPGRRHPGRRRPCRAGCSAPCRTSPSSGTPRRSCGPARGRFRDLRGSRHRRVLPARPRRHHSRREPSGLREPRLHARGAGGHEPGGRSTSRPTSSSTIASRLESGEVVAFDSRHRRKDGSTFPVEVRLRRFRQEGKRFAVALVRDITAAQGQPSVR